MCVKLGREFWCYAYSPKRGEHLVPFDRKKKGNRRRWKKIAADGTVRA